MIFVLMGLAIIVFLASMVGLLLLWRGSWGGFNEAFRIWRLRTRFYPGPPQSEYHIINATKMSRDDYD